jgi:tRNA-splicing ligase RtcB
VTSQLKKIDPYRYIVPKNFRAGMNVEGLIYANDDLIQQIENDLTLQQVANVATLPGLVGRSMAMPDAHQGYGFAIGGVAAMDMEKGVVSAGGVGFDINCGVRLLASDIIHKDLEEMGTLDMLLDRLFADIPCGAGRTGLVKLGIHELDEVLRKGARWAVGNGYGTPNDLDFIEENGEIGLADPSLVSRRAKERGKEQLGTLGSGNHFVEVQYVAEIFDEKTASVFGLEKNQIVVLVHTGSRGLGHQVCTDYLETMLESMTKYGIHVVDRQLASVPIGSKEGQNYLSAMHCAANFAFANRQIITHWIREAFRKALNANLRIVYDVAHNIAKRENHMVEGNMKKVLVHRKGATRAFPAGRPELPPLYRSVGQPVLIPGSMGTSSYVLVGTERAMEETFGSTCHGAGRTKSRHAAKRETSADELIERLRAKGIHIRGASKNGLTEESPEAYKDVSQVVEVVHQAGIARKVAMMIPIGVIKG